MFFTCWRRERERHWKQCGSDGPPGRALALALEEPLRAGRLPTNASGSARGVNAG
jgi:hypothetical protein